MEFAAKTVVAAGRANNLEVLGVGVESRTKELPMEIDDKPREEPYKHWYLAWGREVPSSVNTFSHPSETVNLSY
jgi:hypothetical protein